MRQLSRGVVALLLLTVTAAVEAQTAGEAFPLTNTRYASAPGTPLLRTNGRDFFLFWRGDGKIRATKLVEGQDRAGHVVFDHDGEFDAAWTGTHFVTVTARRGSPLFVGRLDARANPIGAAFELAHGFGPARVAVNGGSIAVVYSAAVSPSGYVTRMQALAPDGSPSGTGRILTAGGGPAAIAGNGSGFVVALMVATGIEIHAVDAAGTVTATSVLNTPSQPYSAVSLTSNGSSSLLTWAEHSRVMAVRLDTRGVPGAPFIVEAAEGAGFGLPSAVWNGNGWSVAYARPSGPMQIAHLNSGATTIVRREHASEQTDALSLATTSDRTMIAWQSGFLGSARIAVLPLGHAEPREATFAATQQTLLTTASSPGATLVVWLERGDGGETIRAGVRTNSGNWSEHEIAAGEFDTHDFDGVDSASAASDGRNFVVLLDTARRGVEAIRLDERGARIGPPLHVSPRRDSVIAWNGRHYAIITSGEGRLLSPSGAMSPPVPIGLPDWSVPHSLASDGSGFLLTTGRRMCPISFSCDVVGVFATRLGSELQRLEKKDIVLAALDQTDFVTNVVWSGSDYVTAWKAVRGPTYIGRIAPAPGGTVETQRIEEVFTELIESHVPTMLGVTGDGGIAIAGEKPERVSSTTVVPVRILTFVSRDGTVRRRLELHRGMGLTATARLAPLSEDRLVYIASSVQNAAPHHGTSHVMATLIAPSLPSRPPPPRITVRESATHWTLSWTAPPAVVNGYRVEYRLNDGSWIEIEKWFLPSDLGTSIRKRTAGASIVVRVRAFNDGGASDYSNIDTPKAVRRRAVR